MGEDGPKGDIGEKVCTCLYLGNCTEKVWLWPENIKKRGVNVSHLRAAAAEVAEVKCHQL